MEWLNDFFTALDEFVDDMYYMSNEMINNINQLVQDLNAYIKFSTYYIWASGALLLIMFIMIWALHTKMDRMAEENTKIQNQLTMVLKHVKPKEVADKNIEELIVLSKSNSKYHSEYAKRELERLQAEGGNTDGTTTERDD